MRSTGVSSIAWNARNPVTLLIAQALPRDLLLLRSCHAPCEGSCNLLDGVFGRRAGQDHTPAFGVQDDIHVRLLPARSGIEQLVEFARDRVEQIRHFHAVDELNR
jgi:hypothetical protein